MRWTGTDDGDEVLLEVAAREGFRAVVLYERNSLSQPGLLNLAARLGVGVVAIEADDPIEAKERLLLNFASIENVLVPKHFARLREGMTQEDVLRVIGPPFPGWTQYFSARNELVWEWRWCDDFNEPARFNVFFDGKSGKVRTTASLSERQSMPFGRGDRRDWCAR